MNEQYLREQIAGLDEEIAKASAAVLKAAGAKAMCEHLLALMLAPPKNGVEEVKTYRCMRCQDILPSNVHACPRCTAKLREMRESHEGVSVHQKQCVNCACTHTRPGSYCHDCEEKIQSGPQHFSNKESPCPSS